MSLGTFVWILVVAYVLIAVLAFIFNASIGPVSTGLALMRAVLWPLWMLGFIPGEQMPMD